MVDVQGAVYHWTISTGFSLAEATNLYVGQPGQLLSHLQDWYTLLCSACTQVTILLLLLTLYHSVCCSVPLSFSACGACAPCYSAVM